MATRSNIAKVQADGKVKAIYSHWDGYLEGVGAVLEKFYSKENLIDKLLDQGDISSIAGDLKECIFYCRDRKEDLEDVKARVFDSLKDYLESDTQEYCYVRNNGIWYVREGNEKKLDILEKRLKEIS